MRPRTLAEATGVVALALTLGWVLSFATTRVVNWFVMTDELYYGRIAIAVAQTGSLPRGPTKGALTGGDRPAGVLLRAVSLADEAAPTKRCPA